MTKASNRNTVLCDVTESITANLSGSAEDTGDLVKLVDLAHARKQRLQSVHLGHYTAHCPDVNR